MVNEQRLTRWLREVRAGRRTVAAVVRDLRHPPIDHLGFAQLDTHRRLRRGLPEAVLCEGKTSAQIVRLARRIIASGELLVLTRLDPATASVVQQALPAVRYDPMARLGYRLPAHRLTRRGLVVVVSAGTADLPVAEEAALTAELLGSRAARLYDVGVAGIHRVLNAFPLLQRARAVVVVAGMEGALASVVGGLVRCPVVAVPTSIGYGANFAGVGPLLTMLNSCVPGIGVVNIDNGFGAGYLAHLINHASNSR
ncbi:MAG: nickel pincer cofactor biosynthesis protein LarB [Candidatus Omnitrophica bacterium]|nr:nickel pincer cofactor biosynthesis protein LarB [Candidatus Omnitrophota bacterium]